MKNMTNKRLHSNWKHLCPGDRRSLAMNLCRGRKGRRLQRLGLTEFWELIRKLP